MGKCIIVGAGDYFGIRKRIMADDYVIAADGGYDYLVRDDIVPDLLIGDMDSISKAVNFTNSIKLPVMKDDTDMIAAIKEGLKRGYTQFEIYGALGGRLDHTIANIQTLFFLKRNNASGKLFGKEDSIELLCNERKNFTSDMEGTISVFAYGGDAGHVTEKGLEYEITDVTLESSFPIGVSNRFTGKPSMIEVKDGKLLLYIEKDKSM